MVSIPDWIRMSHARNLAARWFSLGILTGITTASILHALTRTRTYGRIVRWIWTADVRHTDPHLYGRHAR